MALSCARLVHAVPPGAAGGTPAEREARSQLVAGFNRLCDIVTRVQHEAVEAHVGPKSQPRVARAGQRFRENLKASPGTWSP